MIELSKIKTDGGTQAREKLDQAVVADYAEAYRNGVKMPAVVLFYDGSTYWLADGFHRYFGAKQAGLTIINECVEPGTQRDAILYSVGANSSHGLRRTTEDKRRSVVRLLSDKEWSAWSDRQIAEKCGVSHTFVASIRNPEVADRQQKNRNNSERRVESDSTPKNENPVAAPAKESKSVESDSTQAQNDADYDFQAEAVESLSSTVVTLSAENDALKDRLAVAAMDATEEEKQNASKVITFLREEVARLNIEVKALTASRNTYQRENAEIKKQCASQRRQLDKLSKAA